MGLIKALTTWLEVDAAVKLARAEAMEDEAIEHAEGNNFSQSETGNIMPMEPELHAGYRPGHFWFEDRGHISLRWRPPC